MKRLVAFANSKYCDVVCRYEAQLVAFKARAPKLVSFDAKASSPKDTLVLASAALRSCPPKNSP